MKLYRFSPIETKEQLLQAIIYTHLACHQLCEQSLGKYLPVVGDLGVFCHYDYEYDKLVAIQKELVNFSDSFNGKYFRLNESITIATQDGVPEATYTHLYVRKPDPYRSQVGDLDFYMTPDDYSELKSSLTDGKVVKGARTFGRADLDMIELYDPDIDTLGYLSTHKVTDKEPEQPHLETKL